MVQCQSLKVLEVEIGGLMFGFDMFSGYLGYILWYLFNFTGNYGTAVIIFTFIVNIITLPIVIKTNHKMGSNEKFEAKRRIGFRKR